MQLLSKTIFLYAMAVSYASTVAAQTQKEQNLYRVAVAFAKAPDQTELLSASRLDAAAAVKYCLIKANASSLDEIKSMPGYNIIGNTAREVSVVSGIPAGHIIGFVRNGKAFHVMISGGLGVAIGLKNLKNIGLGTDSKWEVLNLNNLPKSNTGVGFSAYGKSFTLVSISPDELGNLGLANAGSSSRSNQQQRPPVPADPGADGEPVPPPPPAEEGPASLPNSNQKNNGSSVQNKNGGYDKAPPPPNQQWANGQKPVSINAANNQNANGYDKAPPPSRNNNVQAGQQRTNNNNAGATNQNNNGGYDKAPPPPNQQWANGQKPVSSNATNNQNANGYDKAPPPPRNNNVQAGQQRNNNPAGQNNGDGYQSLPASADNRINGNNAAQTTNNNTQWKNGKNPNPAVQEGRYPPPPPPRNGNVQIGANRSGNNNAPDNQEDTNGNYQSLPINKNGNSPNSQYSDLTLTPAKGNPNNKQPLNNGQNTGNQYQPLQELPKDGYQPLPSEAANRDKNTRQYGNTNNNQYGPLDLTDENGQPYPKSFLIEKKNSKGEIEYFHPKTNKQVFPVYSKVPKNVSVGQYDVTPGNKNNQQQPQGDGYQSLPSEAANRDKNTKQYGNTNSNQYQPLQELPKDGYQSLPSEAANRDKNTKQYGSANNNQYGTLELLDENGKPYPKSFLVEKKNSRGETEYYHPKTNKQVYPVYNQVPKNVSIGQYDVSPANQQQPKKDYQSLPINRAANDKTQYQDLTLSAPEKGDKNKKQPLNQQPANANNQYAEMEVRPATNQYTAAQTPAQKNVAAGNLQYDAPPVTGNNPENNQYTSAQTPAQKNAAAGNLQYDAPPVTGDATQNQQRARQNVMMTPGQRIRAADSMNAAVMNQPRSVKNGNLPLPGLNGSNNSQGSGNAGQYGELTLKPTGDNKPQYAEINLSDEQNKPGQYGTTYPDPMLNLKNLGKSTVKDWAPDGDKTPIANANAQFVNYRKYEKERIKNINQYVTVAHNFYTEHPTAKTVRLDNGDLVIYDSGYNLFAVYTNDGLPKIMFCPPDRDAWFENYTNQ